MYNHMPILYQYLFFWPHMQHPEYRLGRVCHTCLPYVSCLWTLYCESRSFLLAFDEGLRHLLLNSTKRSNSILWWSMYIDCHSNQNKGLSTNCWKTGLNHFSIYAQFLLDRTRSSSIATIQSTHCRLTLFVSAYEKHI